MLLMLLHEKFPRRFDSQTMKESLNESGNRGGGEKLSYSSLLLTQIDHVLGSLYAETIKEHKKGVSFVNFS